MGLSAHELLLVLRARDEASRVLRGLSRNVSSLSAASLAAAQAQFAHGAALATIGVGVAAAGVAGALALNDMADAAMNYNEQAAKTLTQVDGINISLDELKNIGRRVANDLPVQFDQVQGALYDIFSSIDVNAPEAEVLLRGIGKAAVAGSVDMETAGRANIAILNAWQMKATDINHVNDVMFQLVRKGVGTYDEFGSSIGRAIPSAVKAGQSIESLAGMMAFLTRNGLSTAMSATSAARALDAMSNPKTITHFKEIGIAITDASGNFRPMSEILSELKVKFEGLSESARAAKLQELFKGSGGTIQAMRFFNLALNDSNSLLQQLTADMNNAGGAADAAYAVMANTPQGKLQMMNNAWETMKTVLGDQILPIKMKIVEVLTQIFQWFNSLSPSTQEWIVKIAALGVVLAIVGGAILAVVGTFMMLGATAAIMGVSLGAVAGIVLGIMAGLAALAAVGYLVVQNWDTIKAAGMAAWGYIKPFIDIAIKAVTDFAEHVKTFALELWQVIGPTVMEAWNKITEGVANMVNTIRPYWDKFVAALEVVRTKAVEIGTGVGQFLSNAFDFLKPIIYALGVVFTTVFSVIGHVVGAVFGMIGGLIGNLIQIITGIINFLVAVFTGQWSDAWNAVLEILKGVWGAIASVFVGAWNTIWAIVEGFVAGIIGFFQHLWDVLVGHSIVPDMINAIIDWFKSLPGKVIDFVKALVSNVINFFINLHQNLVAKVATLIDAVIAFFREMPGKVIGAISSLAGSLWSKGVEWLNSLVGGVNSIAGNLWSFFSGIPGRIVSSLGSLGSLLFNAGTSILQGLLNGLRSKFDDVKNFVGGIATWIKNNKGPKEYDLKLLRPAGNWIMTGLVDSMRSNIPALQGVLNEVAATVTNSNFGNPPVVFGGGGPGGTNYGTSSNSGAPAVQVDVYTEEIDPVKHAADLGWEVARRLGF